MFFQSLFAFVFVFTSLAAAANSSKSLLGNAPLAFEPNRGQWAAGVSFGTRAGGFSAVFLADGAVRYRSLKGAEITARWVGGASANPAGLDRLPGTANYYNGRDKSQWDEGVPIHARVKMAEVYPGIDVVYYGRGQQLEYDLIVAPGADPRRVALSFEAGTAVPRVEGNGNLVVGELVQHRPVAYQLVAGTRVAVDARYVVRRGNVRLSVGKYDRTRELVIDPAIVWSTTLGSGDPSKGAGRASAIAVDPSGNIIVSGTTNATDFPVVNSGQPNLGANALQQAFVTKFTPDGSTILYSTYFGVVTQQNGLTVDSSGNAILGGTTTSSSFPLKNAFQSRLSANGSAFLAKIGANGTLQSSTLLGVTGFSAAHATGVDAAGNMYVAGSTDAPDFPTTAGYQPALRGQLADIFVSKFSPDGSSLLLSVVFGGSRADIPFGMALGADGSIYLTGTTQSVDFPTTANALVKATGALNLGFVVRVAPSGALMYSTYIGTAPASGTSPALQPEGIDVDSAGSAYVVGLSSGGLPIKNAIQGTNKGAPFGANAFLTKFSPDGSSLVYSTYFGGSFFDSAASVRVDAAGSPTVVGYVGSSDFPTVAAFQPQKLYPYTDGFVAKFTPTGNGVVFSSFIGGIASAVALDSAGNIYIAGVADSSDFPSLPSRYGNTPFVLKLSGGPTASVPVTFNTVPGEQQMIIDGAALTSPVTLQWAPGIVHSLDLPVAEASTVSGPYFISWSQGGPKAQTMLTPATTTTFTATVNIQNCVYSVDAPAALSTGQAALQSTFFLKTQLGCPWTATSNAPFLAIITPASSFGPQTITYNVAFNPAGGTRTGVITAGNATFTVTQADIPTPVNRPPSIYLFFDSASSAGAFSTTVQYSVTAPDGLNTLSISNFLINDFLDGRKACYLAFDHAAKVLYLVDDAGIAITGMQFDSTGRGIGTLANSQCTVNGPGTAIRASTIYPDTTMGLAIGLTFTGAFSGDKVVYCAARDKRGQNTGWKPLAVWRVPPASSSTSFPSVAWGLYLPSDSTVPNVQMYYLDEKEFNNLSTSQILINSALDGRKACYVGYDRIQNLLYLVNDAGDALLPAITPGVGTGTQQNSQCMISAVGGKVTASGQSFQLAIRVNFRPSFAGPKIMYGGTQTIQGINSGWHAVNYVTVR